MNKCAEQFDIISKLSSVESVLPNNGQHSYEQLFEQINKQLAPLINKSTYPQKSRLKAEMDSALLSVQLFLRYPYLYGKTAVGILTSGADGQQTILRNLQMNKGFLACLNQRSIPFILYDDDTAGRITATNRSDITVQLTTQEYRAATALYQAKIKIADLVKSFSFSANLKYQQTNYLVFPLFADHNSSEYQKLSSLCSVFLIIHDDKMDYTHLPMAVVSRNSPIVIVADQIEDTARDAAKYVKNHYSMRHVQLVTMADIHRVLQPLDQPQKNFIFYDRILKTLLNLQCYLHNAISTHTQNITGLAHDTLYADTVQEIISGLRENEFFLRDLEEKTLQAVNSAASIIMEQSNKMEAELQSNLSYVISDALSRVETTYISDYTQLAEEIILLALESSNFALANQYIHRLELQNNPFAYIYDLYSCEAMKKDLCNEEIKKLQNEPSNHQIVLHAKVHFYTQIGLTEDARNGLCTKILKKSAAEMYYAACETEKKQGLSAALILYSHASDLGNIQASERLVDYYVASQQGNHFQLKKLADRLIPKAAFVYGQQCLNTDHYAQGITYLRIASSFLYTPAILFYADFLFDKLKKKYTSFDSQIDLALYQMIYKNKLSNNGIAAKIGILYHMRQEYGQARKFLEEDHSLPEASFRLGAMYFYGNSVSKDDSLSEKYLLPAAGAGHTKAKELLEKVRARKNQAETFRHNNQRQAYHEHQQTYTSKADYADKSQKISSTDDGCFITTATCLSEGKPDNCCELEAFRKYRDEVLLNSEEGKALVHEYYQIAPSIVSRISKETNAAEIYRFLFEHYIEPGYMLLSAGKGEQAKALYIEGVLMLAKRYHIKISLEESHLVKLDDRKVLSSPLDS